MDTEQVLYVHTTDDCVYSFTLPGSHIPFQVAHVKSTPITQGIKLVLEYVKDMYKLEFTDTPVEELQKPKVVDMPAVNAIVDAIQTVATPLVEMLARDTTNPASTEESHELVTSPPEGDATEESKPIVPRVPRVAVINDPPQE